MLDPGGKPYISLQRSLPSIVLVWLILLLPFLTTAQQYTLNKNASKDNCNCYTLTRAENWQSGSVWNNNKIDLNNPFRYNFNIFLGCEDANGADGIAFVLQPISTSIGVEGGGMGLLGVNPSVGITLDTWQNNTTDENFADPAYDHIAIQINGDLNHNSSNNLAGPVRILENSDNAEDCAWHQLTVSWDPVTRLLRADVDGRQRASVTIDLVTTVFKGDPLVFWGFTGSTGGSNNLQRFCTSLNPNFALDSSRNTCFPTPVSFIDNSTSFGSIDKWFWNFGDGTTDTVQNPGIHTYPAPGNYLVTLNILGNDGCVSDTFRQTVVMGSKPTAGFTLENPPFCDSKPISLRNASSVQFGTINEYKWTINGSTDIYLSQPGLFYSLPVGTSQVQLTVRTKEGCVSDVFTENIQVSPSPKVDLSFVNACAGDTIPFNGTDLDPAVPIAFWKWELGNGNTRDLEDFDYAYPLGGNYDVSLFATGTNGCPSDTVTRPITIFSTNAFAGNDTVIAIDQPLQLQATGGEFYSWSPAFGLSSTNISNPVAVLKEDARYILTASSSLGCISRDTINIKVFKGPAFYIPSAFTPNGDGRNDLFRFVAIGITEIKYFRVFNRFGQAIYSSIDPKSGWDGKHNGKEQATGTYVWMIEGRDYLGNMLSKKGMVTLIR